MESASLVGNASLFQNIEEASFEVTDPLKKLFQHFSETLVAYRESYGLEDKVPLTVTGQLAFSPLGPPLLSEFVGVPLSSLHDQPPSSEHGLPTLTCASAIGGAFLGHPGTKEASLPNFRVEEFAFTKPLMHWKRPLLAFTLGSLLLAYSIFWWGEVRTNEILKRIQSDWVAITKQASLTPDEVLELFTKEKGARADLTTPDSLVEQADFLLERTRKRTLFPLHPNVPHISDFFAWFSKEVDEVLASDPSKKEKIELQNFHYSLVKRPEKNSPKEHYQARVDLELSSTSATLARALHDKLLASNPMIDPQVEVKWVPMNGRYKVTLFLRDKTHYPPQEL